MGKTFTKARPRRQRNVEFWRLVRRTDRKARTLRRMRDDGLERATAKLASLQSQPCAPRA